MNRWSIRKYSTFHGKRKVWMVYSRGAVTLKEVASFKEGVRYLSDKGVW